MIEGGHCSRGAGNRRWWPGTGASPRLSWRRAGSQSCCVSCRVISHPVGPPRPGRPVPDTGRSMPVRPTSSSASYLRHAHY